MSEGVLLLHVLFVVDIAKITCKRIRVRKLLLCKSRHCVCRLSRIRILLLRETCNLIDVRLILPRDLIGGIALDVVHRARRHGGVQNAAIAKTRKRSSHRVLDCGTNTVLHIRLIRLWKLPVCK